MIEEQTEKKNNQAEELQSITAPKNIAIIVISAIVLLTIGGFILFKSQKPVETQTTSPSIAEPTKPQIINAESRNIKRRADIGALVNAVVIYKLEHENKLPEGITSKAQPIAKSGADICAAIVPEYIGALPRDPNQQVDPENPNSTGGSITVCDEEYDTGYTISKNEKGWITIIAPKAEGEEITETK